MATFKNVNSIPERLLTYDLGADDAFKLHASCVYARCESVVEEPSVLLDRAGYRVKELRDSKEMTHCCGGPVEPLYSKLARRIGKKGFSSLRTPKLKAQR